jgi:phosphatidate cytidylyltransferase
MVKNRLLFGILMSVFFTGVVILDGWLDGSITKTAEDNAKVQGTIFCILIFLLAIPANLELSKLASFKNVKIFVPVSIAATILLSESKYLAQFGKFNQSSFIIFLLVFTFLTIYLFQYLQCGLSSVIPNCGATCFVIFYLGLLSYFAVAIRVEFGLWPLLMYIFVVKSTDIGAYTAGTLFGKHKFSPKISPGKTWEGMAGGLAGSLLVSIGFAAGFGIMDWKMAIVFGLCLAFIGQLGDLMESMMKRDAQQKDSAKIVPGFGGVLDIIDSPLATAPFAYLFFMLAS